MINKISIKNVASYGNEPAVLETDKKTNLIYGLNGTGKTIFSNYLQNKNHADFSDCSINDINNEKILVYNQKFIEENFYEKPEQKGIFTLSSENKEAEEKIKNAREEIKNFTIQLKDNELQTGLQVDLVKKEAEIITSQDNIKDKTWKIKTQYTGGDRVFDDNGFLDKLKVKKNLFEYLISIKLAEPTKKIEEIKTELQELGKEAQERNLLTSIDPQLFSNIEKNTLFQEAISGNKDNSVAKLIAELQNSDWVKRGLDYVDLEKRENCPFCQKETLTDELIKEIKKYFDTTYEGKIQSLQDLQAEYQSFKDNLKLEEYKKSFFSKDQELEITDLFNALSKILFDNISLIKDKENNPSKEIELFSSQQEIEKINDFINQINEEISKFNKKLQNRMQTIEELKKEFWNNQRKNYDSPIVDYEKTQRKLENEKSGIQTKINELNENIKKQRNIILESEKGTININKAIDNINIELMFLGIEGFQIVTAGENSYKLERKEIKADFKTLSEGEKTIISFLYFLELYKGKGEKDETVTEKIIVIDDPISSLSHIYVFNIAQLIRKNFFDNNYNQVFILTHNLYFFHELLHKKRKKDRKLFRITKSQDNKSNIFDMEQDDIQNDYQAYWQIIKDHTPEKCTNTLLAIAMRNILENFFGFINKADFNELPLDPKYKFFARYINRENHSDAINISDTKDIDPEIFKEAFEKIFKEAGYEEHYNKMMEQ